VRARPGRRGAGHQGEGLRGAHESQAGQAGGAGIVHRQRSLDTRTGQAGQRALLRASSPRTGKGHQGRTPRPRPSAR
jgi:hypothetical protein